MGKWSHTIHPFTDFELVKRASPGQLTPEQSSVIPTALPRPHTPGRLSMGLLVRTPRACPSTVIKAWAGKPLPSLSRPSSPRAPREGSEDKRLLVLQLRVATGFRLQPPQFFQRVLSSALSDYLIIISYILLLSYYRVDSLGGNLGMGHTRGEHGTSWFYRCIQSISKGSSLSCSF